MKLYALFIVIIMMVLSSCNPAWYCKRCDISEHQNVITDTVYKDSIVHEIITQPEIIKIPVPQDSLLIKALVECDSLNRAQLEEYIIKSNNMIVKLKIHNGKLEQNIQTTMDSLTTVIQHKTELIKELRDNKVVQVKETTKIKNVKYIPLYIKVLGSIGAIALIMLLFILLFNIFGKR